MRKDPTILKTSQIRLNVYTFSWVAEIVFPNWYVFIFWRWRVVWALLLVTLSRPSHSLNRTQGLNSSNKAGATSLNTAVYWQLQLIIPTPSSTPWSLWASFLGFGYLAVMQNKSHHIYHIYCILALYPKQLGAGQGENFHLHYCINYLVILIKLFT